MCVFFFVFFLFFLFSCQPIRVMSSQSSRVNRGFVDVLNCWFRFHLTNDDEFRFNDASTHEGHLRQNGELTWFCNETIIMMSCMHKV